MCVCIVLEVGNDVCLLIGSEEEGKGESTVAHTQTPVRRSTTDGLMGGRSATSHYSL